MDYYGNNPQFGIYSNKNILKNLDKYRTTNQTRL